MQNIPSLVIILAYWLSCICIADTPEFNSGNYDVSQFDFLHMGLNESRGVNQRNPFVDNFLVTYRKTETDVSPKSTYRDNSRADEFGHPIHSIEHFEVALRKGDISRFLFDSGNDHGRFLPIFAKNLKARANYIASLMGNSDEWAITFERYDRYRLGDSTHKLIDDFLFELYPVPDGIISIAQGNGYNFRFPYIDRDGVKYLRSGRLIKRVKNADSYLAVTLGLSLEEIDYVKLEFDFLIESALVTYHSLWERSYGGFNLKGDQFIELRILESAKNVRIDQISIFQGSITDNEVMKQYDLSIIEEEDFIRIIPATVSHDKL